MFNENWLWIGDWFKKKSNIDMLQNFFNIINHMKIFDNVQTKIDRSNGEIAYSQSSRILVENWMPKYTDQKVNQRNQLKPTI